MSKRGLLTLLVAGMGIAQAVSQPSPPGEPHIQSVSYAPEQVVTVRAALGYAVVVELSEDEHVENLVVGNSGVWQVTANKRGDHIVIKPLTGATETNLVVTTDTRRYVFLLQPSDSPESAPFVVRFNYPRATIVTPVAITTSVARYKLRGDKMLFPTAISDDGQRTTVTWDRSTPLPAIFASDKRGREAIVNGRIVDGDYVIQGIAPRYVFRRGKAHASATRHLIKAAH